MVALKLILKCQTGPCQTEQQLFDVSEWDCAGDQVGRNESDDAQWIVTTSRGVMLDVTVKGRKAALNGRYELCTVNSKLFILIRLVNIFSPADMLLLILPVLCGCETCFLSLREEHRLRIH